MNFSLFSSSRPHSLLTGEKKVLAFMVFNEMTITISSSTQENRLPLQKCLNDS